jgi:hypothetical protein
MKLRSDNQGRISCREFFPPKAAFDATRQPDGSVRVVELVEKTVRPAKVRFEKRGRYTVGVSDQPVTEAAIKEALAEFP